jgi:Na+/melibiose symporter-like transporter
MNYSVKRKDKIFYGMGNFGYGVVSQTYNNLIMFFGTTVLGVSGTLMGVAVAVSVMWDAVTDPAIGYLSDKQESPLFGKRHGFMLFGFLGMALFNILIWSVPSFLTTSAKFVWLLVSMLALETFNTMFATPYTALGTELSDDYNERTNIQAYKTIFFLISFLAPSVLMFLFLHSDLTQASQQGYMQISFVTSAIAVIVGLLSVFGTFSTIPKLKKKYALAKKEKKERTPTQILKMFFYSLKRRNYNSLIGGYAISLISSAIITGVGLHLFTYGFYFSKTQISIILASLVLATIVSQPFWVKISKKYEKKPSLLKAILISLLGVFVITAAFMLRLQIGVTASFIICIIAILISGFGTGALYSLPISMFADLITLEYAKTEKESTGIYSGFMTFAYKLANAVALLVVGILLDVIQFDATLVTQPISVQNGLGVVAILGISIALISSYFIYAQYTVKRVQVEKANKRITKINKVKEEGKK